MLLVCFQVTHYLIFKNFVRSEPLDFSLQVDSPRNRTDRALALEVRFLRKDLRYENRALLVARSQTKRAKLSRSDFWQPGERDSSIEGLSVASPQWRLKARGSLRISILIKSSVSYLFNFKLCAVLKSHLE